jgi:hypothetical protein
VNRHTLDQIAGKRLLFEAWSDEPWVIDGAAVRVSLLCFGIRHQETRLNGVTVQEINSDLTGGSFNFTASNPLRENRGIAARRIERGGEFQVEDIKAPR